MRHLLNVSARFSVTIALVALLSTCFSQSTANSKERTAGRVSGAGDSASAESNPAPVQAARLSSRYGKLPISFEVNQGQTDKAVQFLARAGGYTLFLSPNEAVMSLRAVTAEPKPGVGGQRKPSATMLADVVRMQLTGASTRVEAIGIDPLPGKSNYFVGNDPAKWHVDVPTYARVRYNGIYPGIDLIYYGNQEGRLEHDFVVAPKADPKAIGIRLHAKDAAFPDQRGGLVLQTKTGTLTLRSPVAYQEVQGTKKMIPARYELARDNQIRFHLESYDRNAPLIIDPVIEYTATWGGSGDDSPTGIAVDSSGNAYVEGTTTSTDFPVVSPFQGSWTPSSSGGSAAFVSKINAAGTALLYSTYLGGPSTKGLAIAVDKVGHACITGSTGDGFPLKNAYQSTNGGGLDVFISVLSPAGDSLVYSTYLGGGGWDHPFALAMDDSGNAYISGANGSGSGFPLLNSIQLDGNSFVAKYNSVGQLQYSSTFGDGLILGITADSQGFAYAVGSENPAFSSIPITKGAFQSTCTPPQGPYNDYCGYILKLTPEGKVVYGTFLSNNALAVGVAVDSSGSAYLTGTAGEGFPVTKHAFQKAFGGGNFGGFVAKVNATGTGLVWSTYLGGSSGDNITALALDQHRTVYILGWSANSPNFPLKASLWPYDGSPESSGQAFVTTLSGDLSSINYYSSYFGSGGPCCLTPTGIAVDKALNVYLTGTDNGSLKPTPGALAVGSGHGFVSKIVTMDDISTALNASATSVAQGSNLTYTIAVTSKGPDFGWNVLMNDDLAAGTTFVSYDAGGGTCTAPAPGARGTLNCQLLQLNAGDTWTVTLTVNVNAAPGSTLSNSAAAISNMQDFSPQNNTGTLTTPVVAAKL